MYWYWINVVINIILLIMILSNSLVFSDVVLKFVRIWIYVIGN